MRVFILHILLAVSFQVQLGAQEWKWAKTLDGKDSSAFTGFGSACRYLNDRVAISGYFGSPDLVLGDDTLMNKGGTDPFIAILDKNGVISKAINIGDNGLELISSIVSDKEGNIYACGFFDGLEFKIGRDTLINQGENDAFLTKIDSFGNVVWTLHTGTLANEENLRLTMSEDGYIYMMRHSFDRTSSILDSITLSKISVDKEIIWEKTGINEVSAIQPLTIAVDKLGNAYLSGRSQGILNFGNDTSIVLDSLVFRNFIIQFDSEGNIIKSVTEDADFWMQDVVAYKDGILYSGNSSLDMSYRISSEIKYLNANLDEVGKYEITRAPIGDEAQFTFRSIAITEEEEILLASFYNGETSFGKDTLSSWGEAVLKFDSTLTPVWAETITGDGNFTIEKVVQTDKDHYIAFGNFGCNTLTIGEQMLQNNNDEICITIHGSTFCIKIGMVYLAGLSEKVVSSSFSADQLSGKLLLYPNPTTNTLYLQLEAFTGQPVQVQIFSADGRLVRQQHISGATPTIQVQTADLPPGMYIATTIVNQQISSAKFIKQ